MFLSWLLQWLLNRHIQSRKEVSRTSICPFSLREVANGMNYASFSIQTSTILNVSVYTFLMLHRTAGCLLKNLTFRAESKHATVQELKFSQLWS